MKGIPRRLTICAILIAFRCSPTAERKTAPEEKRLTAIAAPQLVGAPQLQEVTISPNIRLLIVPDGFTTAVNDVTKFNNEVAKVMAAFALLPGVNAQAIPSAMSRSSKTSGTSTLGLTYLGNDPAFMSRCYFDGRAAANITLDTLDPSFSATNYIVIVEQAGGIGCKTGKTVFINSDTLEGTIVHEMGHSLIGLYDESGTKPDAPPQIEWRNCADNQANPQFGTTLGTPVSGCHGYSRLFHARANYCRMENQSNSHFCGVCENVITRVVTGVPPAQPPAPTALDVTALLNANGTVQVLKVAPARPERLLPETITGETFVVARDASEIVGIEPLAIDDGIPTSKNPDRRIDLRDRSYPPYGRGEEISVPADSQLIHIVLKGVTTQKAFDPEYKLSLDVLNLGDARRRPFVDDTTITNLKRLPFHGIDLGTAIRNQLNLH